MAAHVLNVESDGPDRTAAIAAELAGELRAGDCIALHGELGAGKTQFVRGLVAGLGGPVGQVCSPTFVLLNVYKGGRLTVYHLDAYRIGGCDDFEEIGFSELLEQGGIVAVEWAERVGALLPPKHVEVVLTPLSADKRIIQIHRRDAP
jgi:tRNA threonylcarbamoyladenosine biosynthesis protein TsaE